LLGPSGFTKKHDGGEQLRKEKMAGGSRGEEKGRKGGRTVTGFRGAGGEESQVRRRTGRKTQNQSNQKQKSKWVGEREADGGNRITKRRRPRRKKKG